MRIDYDALEDEFEDEPSRADQLAIAANKLKKTVHKKDKKQKEK